MPYKTSESKLFVFLVLGIVIFFGCQQNEELSWVEEDGYSWTDVNPKWSFFDSEGFELLSPNTTGVNFTNIVTKERVKDNRVLINGSGVATGDIDGDGLTDIYFGSIAGSNKLYKNSGGWEFTDITDKAGVGMPDSYSTGVALADFDADKDLDLVVATIGDGNKLFINDGKGHFTEKINALKTDRKYGSHSVAVADIEKDGDLDIYITNYKVRSAKDLYPNERSYGHIVKKEGDEFSIYSKFKDHYRIEERGDFILWFETGESDLLYLNDGTGNFKNVSSDSGIFRDSEGASVSMQEMKDWGLHAKFSDLNNDLYPDLYVSNDFESPDRIWINNRNGTFQEIEKTAIRNTSLSSMSVDFSDIDRDGFFDIFIAEMLAKSLQTQKRHLGTMIPLPEPVGVIDNRPQYVGNTLLLNRGDLTFAEVTDYAGIRASDWTWGAQFTDIDLDGYEDLILTNGNYYDSQDLDANNRLQNLIRRGRIEPRDVMLEYPTLKQNNIIFRNKGNLTFEDKSEKWGFDKKDISQGIAMADFDNDGDLDMVINKMNTVSGLYENKSIADRIAVQLVGESDNINAIGSKIEVISHAFSQSKEVSGSGSYLSDSDAIYAFAALADTMSLKITWYDGKISTIDGLKKNRIYRFYKKDLETDGFLKEKKDSSRIYFTDISQALNHKHSEELYDDFNLHQNSLPYRLSQIGPGLSWFDLDKDGYDELIIGNGKGESLSIFKNESGNGFSKAADGFSSLQNDISSVLVQSSAESDIIFSSIYNYEEFQDTSFLRVMDLKSLRNVGFEALILPEPVAPGPLALADYDKDGDLDLFIGGRVQAGKYPAPVSSWLMKNSNDEYSIDKENRFKDIGLVTAATFSDINGDNWPDLLISREWNSLLILINKRGKFVDETSQWGLNNFRGLWNGISTGDFNNDGKMDLIVANAGENNNYQQLIRHSGKDIKLFYYPRENSGTSIIEAYYSNELNGWVPTRRLPALAKEFAVLRNRIKSHKQYSGLTIEEILGVGLNNFKEVSANMVSTSLFLNTGGAFKRADLPIEAQFSRVQGVNVLDYNADGNEDILLTQNFFSSIVETPRSDAGRGLLLRGKGDGEFSAIPGRQSGLKIYGEQKAAGTSDFNLDGKADIAVTQNGSTTKLYKNISKNYGLIVQLEGEASNPEAIGAKLNFIYSNGSKGPVREIKAGSGYLSQNSSTQVMGYERYPEELRIQWPDDRITSIKIPENLLRIHLNYEGKVLDTVKN